jgi:Ulp1 family protease
VIDLEDDSNNRSWRERSSTRSLSLKSDGGVSRPLKKAASKTLAEYQSVESAVNPDRKQAFAKRHRVSDDDVKNISQPASAIPQPAKTRISPDVSLLEDSNDPISDPDANAVSKGNTATKAPGFYKPSLSKKAFKLPASNDHTSHEKDEYKDNQYRSYGGPQPKRSVSLSSDELPDSSTVVQRNAKRQRTSRASDGSMDELQSKFFSPTKQPDHQLKKKAGILLKAIKGKATAPTVETSDTDDEADNKSASIQPSNLSAIKISRPGTATESGHFIVKQVFPIRGGALIGYSKNQWTLEHDIGSKDQKKGRLIFKDSEDKTVVVIHTSSIQKIDWDESAKMIIFRSATENSLCGGRIYLELEDTAASSTFRNRLKKADNTIILVKNTASLENGLSYFDRAFKRPQNHRLEPKKKTPSINDAEDLQLLQSKSEARSDQRWLEKRGAQAGGQARPTGSEQQVGDASQPVKPKSLARSMQTDNTERKNQQIERTGIASPSQAFYGNGNRPLRSAALRENEPIRSSPRVAGRTIAPRPRERTPTPPLTWTELNPEWDKMWNGTVYYPPGERKGQVTVERDDILRLNEGEFLNDNLVTFYLRYLEHTLQENRPEVAKRIYFHNSYFYTTLTKSAKKGINYQAVQRWTKNVDIISKDYIIVPICENLHWYVAIICNASKLLVSEAPEKTELKTTYDNEEEAIQPSTTMQKHVGNTSVEVDGITGNGDTITLKYPSPSAIEPEDCKEPKTVDSTAQASSDANKLCPEGQEARLEVENSSAQTQKEHSEETTSRPEADSDVQNALDGEASAPKPSIDNVVASLEEHPIASIKSDLNGLPTKKSARKAKKGTRAPIRDPTKPRIITLDSLAVTHSVTCTNLKEYLVAEIKDKRGADIVPPKEIGMPARNIPTQDNHCDCGLYLLAYVTKFLESPDDFVLGIYQKREEIGWDPKAPKIRNDVRELLFKLQDTITPQKPAKNRPKQIKTDKPTTSSAGLSAPLPPGTSRLVNAAGPRVGAAEIQGVESLAMTENGMIKQQSTTATPLFDSSVHEKEHANASLQLSSKNGMEDVLSKTTTIILGNEDVQPGRIEVGKSESFPLEIGDSPESKRFRDDSQQQHRMVARNQKTDLLNSQPSSSQPSADSSATFTKQCSAESDKTRSVSMYPDPPSSTGLIDPIDPFIEAPRPSDFLGSEPSTPVNINNSTPQFEKYADRSYEGPRSSTSIHKFDAEDDFDMTGSRIQEPSAFRNIAPGSDDDGVDYAELTQRCRDYHQSSRAIEPEVLVSDENDTMLLDVTEEHEKREINGFFEEDKEYEEADELHNKSIDRSRVNGSFTPDQINKGTKTTFSE